MRLCRIFISSAGIKTSNVHAKMLVAISRAVHTFQPDADPLVCLRGIRQKQKKEQKRTNHFI